MLRGMISECKCEMGGALSLGSYPLVIVINSLKYSCATSVTAIQWYHYSGR